MPIYEYRCKDCRREMSFIVLSSEQAQELKCKHCGSAGLAQLISRFATPRSEDSRLESLADPSKFGDLDENDPKSMARWMKKMGKELGEDMGEDFDQAIEEAMDEEAAAKTGEGGEGVAPGMPPSSGAGEW
jgi:putative FmdB family regulatory protein